MSSWRMIHSNSEMLTNLFRFYGRDFVLKTEYTLRIFHVGIEIMHVDKNGFFPFEFLKHVSGRICNEVKGISRVVYDISSKPPATIEWE